GSRLLLAAICSTLLTVSCASPSTPPSSTRSQTAEPVTAQRQKTLVVGITTPVETMPPMSAATTLGGWRSAWDIFSQGLVTSERETRRTVPRLASKLPTFEDGTIELLPDG